MYTAQNTSDVHPTEEHLFALLRAQPKVNHTAVAQRRNALRQAMAAALVAETTEENPLVSESGVTDLAPGPVLVPVQPQCACA